MCAEQLRIASILHTPKNHFTVLSFLWNYQRSRMSAWRDAWSVRHWAHHGSAKIWVLQSSFGVWNWMGFFGHDFFIPRQWSWIKQRDIKRRNSYEQWVCQNTSEHLDRKSSMLLRAPEAPSCKFSIHSPWAQVEDDKVVFSPQPASWSSFWWRCYIN